MYDTSICLGDSLKLDATTPGAISYSWTSSSSSSMQKHSYKLLSDSTIADPWAYPFGDSIVVKVNVYGCSVYAYYYIKFNPGGGGDATILLASI